MNKKRETVEDSILLIGQSISLIQVVNEYKGGELPLCIRDCNTEAHTKLMIAAEILMSVVTELEGRK